ncbi:MAG: hypothetical protein A3I66_03925 [Burkholderiales bacterium RIFCSPLOWO2_02_FULL_57_36]|nr:MAG: hypothetical protein A3I66_03925 [Burkholderiales bacterium RIFCSPLOWO2_02_FULL_57_36]
MKIRNPRVGAAALIPDTRRTNGLALKAALVAGGVLLSMAAQAQTVVFDETFAAGLGKFTADGTVNTSSGAARLDGCYGCTDGSITSIAISTAGFTGLRLSFDRVTSRLDFGEAGIAEFSTNGSTYTALESIRTASGRVTFNLPTSAENQSSLRLRFRVDASLSYETYTIDNVFLEGTSVTNPPPPPLGTDPGSGPWAPVSAANVAAECKLDPSLLQKANSTLGLRWAVVRYGKLCHEYYPTGSDARTQVYSATKTMSGLTVGALIHKSKSLPASTTRKRGPLNEFQRIDHWLDSFTFHRDSTTAHVLGMVSASSSSLAYPNRVYKYDTNGSDAINRLSDVINTVVAQDTTRLGSNIGAFWRLHFSQPLGLENSIWGTSETSKNFATSWESTIRDMARVGLLMLNGGVWNGQRLVDGDYLYNLAHPSFEDAHTGYGYQAKMNENDSCAPKPIHKIYPHGPVSGAPSCLRAEGCSQTHDAGVFYAAGALGQYIIVHRALDMVIVVKNSGMQSNDEPGRVWNALRPAVVAHDPVYRGNPTGFCTAYGKGNHAPDLKLWEGGR